MENSFLELGNISLAILLEKNLQRLLIVSELISFK